MRYIFAEAGFILLKIISGLKCYNIGRLNKNPLEKKDLGRWIFSSGRLGGHLLSSELHFTTEFLIWYTQLVGITANTGVQDIKNRLEPSAARRFFVELSHCKLNRITVFNQKPLTGQVGGLVRRNENPRF
jgi:hypothetical protein